MNKHPFMMLICCLVCGLTLLDDFCPMKVKHLLSFTEIPRYVDHWYEALHFCNLLIEFDLYSSLVILAGLRAMALFYIRYRLENMKSLRKSCALTAKGQVEYMPTLLFLNLIFEPLFCAKL